MTDCPSCGAVLRGKMCACGYAVRDIPKAKSFTSSPQLETDRAFKAKLREVEIFIEKHKRENPGASTRDASFVYMQQHKLTHLLPKSLRAQMPVTSEKPKPSFDDVMDEYRNQEISA